MGILKSDILPIGAKNACQTEIDHSLVDKISPDIICVSPERLEKKNRDPDFGMSPTSRASSRTLTTEPLDGEEDFDSVDVQKRAIDTAREQIPKKAEVMDESSNAGSEKPEITVDSANSDHEERDGVRKLRWANITIREYGRELGDNVTVMGPPIGLAWEHQDETVYDLREYDDACQYTRRTQSELKMPSKYRDQILKEGGYSRVEIQQAVKKSNIARNQRKRTVETLKLQPLQEAFEKIVRVGKKPLRKKDDHLKMKSKNTL